MGKRVILVLILNESHYRTYQGKCNDMGYIGHVLFINTGVNVK